MIQAETEDGYLVNIPESFNGYEFKEIIGSGSTSVVCLVNDEMTGKLYTAKIIPKNYLKKKKLMKQIKTEISVLKKVNHPNIVKYHDSFKLKNDPNDVYVVIIIEYCPNGDLFTLMDQKGFKNESQKQKIIRQFLEAIKYLHSIGIAHGDIKPENILLDSDFNVKLADFGYSKTEKYVGDESKNGSLYYAAPELFFRGKFDPFKTDIWSIGITLYCLTENSFPYEQGTQDFIIDQITSHFLRFSPNMSSCLKKVVEKCTIFDPKKRPDIEDLLNDEYFVINEKIADSLIIDDYADFYSNEEDECCSIFI